MPNRHILFLHRFRADDTENVVCDHREFQNQSVRFKFAAWQSFNSHIGFYFAVELLTNRMVMVKFDNIFIRNIQRGPVHIDIYIRNHEQLTIRRHGSFGDLINHSDRDFIAFSRCDFAPCASDVNCFSFTLVSYVLADRFQFFSDLKTVFPPEIDVL